QANNQCRHPGFRTGKRGIQEGLRSPSTAPSAQMDEPLSTTSTLDLDVLMPEGWGVGAAPPVGRAVARSRRLSGPGRRLLGVIAWQGSGRFWLGCRDCGHHRRLRALRWTNL